MHTINQLIMGKAQGLRSAESLWVEYFGDIEMAEHKAKVAAKRKAEEELFLREF